MIESQLKENGEKTALICQNQFFSYNELNSHANALANWMLEKGAQKADRALIWGGNKYQMVEFFLACSKIGVITVPVNTRLKETEANYIIEEIQPVFVYCEDQIPTNWSETSSIKGIISLSPKDHADHYETIIGGYSPMLTKELSISPNDPFLIIYTAAVDGFPKGAVLTHENVIACNIQTKQLLEITENDNFGIFTPLYHIAGTSILFCGLHYGLTNIMLPEFNPSDAADQIANHKITIFCSFSPMIQLILDSANEKELDIRTQIRAIFGLDSPEMIQKLLQLNIDFYGIYAQSEVTGVIAAEKYEDPLNQPGLIGFPHSQTTITLLNELGQEVEVGEIGEICVRGKTVFSHYWKRPKETSWALRDGLLHTGDLASRDHQGRLWFKGRKTEKELIKSGGENVYPLEVEQAILQHPSVESVVVIGISDKKWLEAVKAVIVLKNNEIIEDSDIQNFCKSQLAAFKVPKYIEFVKELPVKNGEIDRDYVKKNYS